MTSQDTEAPRTRGRGESDARKREIQLIAADLFQQRGYDGVSVRDIAHAAGITVPTLYWYIGSKQQLLVDLLDSIYTDTLARYQAAANTDAPADMKIRAFFRAGFDLVAERRQELSVLTHERQALDPERRGPLRASRQAIDAVLRDILDQGVREGLWDERSMSSARMVIWSLLNYAAYWFQPDGPKPAAELADDFAEIVLRGMLKPAAK